MFSGCLNMSLLRTHPTVEFLRANALFTLHVQYLKKLFAVPSILARDQCSQQVALGNFPCHLGLLVLCTHGAQLSL